MNINKKKDRVHGCGCSYCAGRKTLKGFNDLESKNPQLAREWDYELNGELVPEMIYYQSHKRVWWKCKEGHSWEIDVYSRSKGSGCPYCINKRPIVGKNDFATVHPELLLEWDYQKNIGISPSEITRRSRKKFGGNAKKVMNGELKYTIELTDADARYAGGIRTENQQKLGKMIF